MMMLNIRSAVNAEDQLFQKNSREPGVVSIARFPPEWYTKARCLPLAPTADMLKSMDRDEYQPRYYDEILSVLDMDEVLRDLNVKKRRPRHPPALL